MPEALFNGPPATQMMQEAARNAREDIRKLTDQEVENPSIAGETEEIIRRRTINVPEILHKDIVCRRVTSKRTIREFGSHRVVDHDELQWMIPFRGDSSALRVSPTSAVGISSRYEVVGQHIQFITEDNESADSAGEGIIANIETNLSALRKNFADQKSTLSLAIESELSARRALIKERRERDSKSKFRRI